MRYLLVPSLIGALAVAVPAVSAAPQQDPAAVVTGWYQRFLHRDPDAVGLNDKAQDLVRTNDPAWVLATIVGSDEYYRNAGYDPASFIRTLFRDITGREPGPRELNAYLARLNAASPIDVAYELIRRHPQALGVTSPRPYYPGRP
jgi:hypothetical protein